MSRYRFIESPQTEGKGSSMRTTALAKVMMALLLAAGISLVLLPAPLFAANTFQDVQVGHDYRVAIDGLAARNIVSGFGDWSFGPEQNVKRQQFAKMIVKTLDLAVTGNEISPFGDVASGQDPADPHYPDKYVAVCAAAGITVGKTPTTFAPYDSITREQLITMIVRAAGLPAPPVGYVPPFSPGQFSIDEHYQNARVAARAGLLEGLVGVGEGYAFAASASRGESAQMLWNLLCFRVVLQEGNSLPKTALQTKKTQDLEDNHIGGDVGILTTEEWGNRYEQYDDDALLAYFGPN